MNSCESHEIALSSLLDGEAEPEHAAAAVEHALGCADCAAFFRAARRLQEPARRLAGEPAGLGVDRAERLWREIDRRSRDAGRVAPRWAGALRAAALVVLGLGGGYLLSTLGAAADSIAPTPRAGVTAANLRDGRPMDERRFVALADELLGAELRYQRAMLEVLKLVPALESEEIGYDDESRPIVRAVSREDGPRAGRL